MKANNLISLFSVLIVSVACSAENDFVGVWEAVSVDMSFAEGQIPADQMDEAMQMILDENAPAFDLNADGTARVFGGSTRCNGKWSVDENIINVECPDDFIMLEINGNQLITLPDRTFTFERQ